MQPLGPSQEAAAVALRHCSLSQLVLAHDHISVKGAEVSRRRSEQWIYRGVEYQIII